jgi:hypothetical protein
MTVAEVVPEIEPGVVRDVWAEHRAVRTHANRAGPLGQSIPTRPLAAAISFGES